MRKQIYLIEMLIIKQVIAYIQPKQFNSDAGFPKILEERKIYVSLLPSTHLEPFPEHTLARCKAVLRRPWFLAWGLSSLVIRKILRVPLAEIVAKRSVHVQNTLPNGNSSFVLPNSSRGSDVPSFEIGIESSIINMHQRRSQGDHLLDPKLCACLIFWVSGTSISCKT